MKSYDPPHLLVFANWHPNYLALSLDRWHVIDDLGDENKLHDFFPPSIWPAVALLTDPFWEGGKGGGGGGALPSGTPRRARAGGAGGGSLQPPAARARLLP